MFVKAVSQGARAYASNLTNDVSMADRLVERSLTRVYDELARLDQPIAPVLAKVAVYRTLLQEAKSAAH